MAARRGHDIDDIVGATCKKRRAVGKDRCHIVTFGGLSGTILVPITQRGKGHIPHPRPGLMVKSGKITRTDDTDGNLLVSNRLHVLRLSNTIGERPLMRRVREAQFECTPLRGRKQ